MGWPLFDSEMPGGEDLAAGSVKTEVECSCGQFGGYRDDDHI
jgi:hypothetical protein